MKPKCDDTLMRQTGSEENVYIYLAFTLALSPLKHVNIFACFSYSGLTILTSMLICQITLTSYIT